MWGKIRQLPLAGTGGTGERGCELWRPPSRPQQGTQHLEPSDRPLGSQTLFPWGGPGCSVPSWPRGDQRLGWPRVGEKAH